MKNSSDTLELFDDEALVFSSRGHWLHPLFEAEEFLKVYRRKGTLRIEDTISGTAAALLTVRLGISEVHAGIMSEGAREVYSRYHVAYSFDTLVPAIECMTERLLTPATALDEAYRILSERARR